MGEPSMLLRAKLANAEAKKEYLTRRLIRLDSMLFEVDEYGRQSLDGMIDDVITGIEAAEEEILDIRVQMTLEGGN